MNKEKFRAGFLSFFFFFQGVFITVMILFAVFDRKVVPVIKEKNTQIEILVNELNKRNYKGPNYSAPKIENSRAKVKIHFIII